MNTRSWAYAAAALCLVSAATTFGFAGCGGDDSTGDNVGSDAAADITVTPDGTVSNDSGGGNPVCSAIGTSCTTSNQCCSANCDPQLKVCAKPQGTCKSPNESCSTSNECCTYTCNGGKCGDKLCTSDNQACASDGECCGQRCVAGADGGPKTCAPLNATCKTAGNACGGHGDCCSKLCLNGVCSNQPSFCTQTGDICSTDLECCGGICNKAQGATVGVCAVPAAPGATGCTISGSVCGAGADGGTVNFDAGIPCGGECCSRSCAPYGTSKVFVCQPASGCRPTGELCRTDSDCCGANGSPCSSRKGDGGPGNECGTSGSVKCSKANASDPVGRCDNGTSCRGAGAVCKLATTSCSAENDCCAGNVNQNPMVCQQDNLGIPRCMTGALNCADAGAGSRTGQACASSADCCGSPCVPNPVDGGSPFVCGATCVPATGKCTTTGDCCSGQLCVIPPGSSTGYCGQPPSDGGTTLPDGGVVIPDGGTTIPDSGTGGSSCALYGQACYFDGGVSTCCNNVPCINGHCQFPF